MIRCLAYLSAVLVCGPLWLPAGALAEGRSDENMARVLRAEQDRIDAIARAVPASVAIFDEAGKGGGSGVVISADGFALTNFHVVQPVGAFMKCGLPDGEIYDAVVVGVDPVGDVALVKIYAKKPLPVAVLGDSDQLQAGDSCFTVGNPFLLATDLQPSVAWGIVSGVHRYQYPAGTLLEYADCIQTDAAINPGNSGGPLFDGQGRLIGVNGRGSFEKRGRVNVGVGYAISINQIKHFLGYLHSGRIVDHATLGATVSSDDEGRVVVTHILDSSDAYRRGLRYRDEIVAFGGRSIGSANAFKNVLGIFPKDWEVSLRYQRGGEQHDVVVRLAGVHRSEELIAKVQAKRRMIPHPQPKKDAPKIEPPKKEEASPHALAKYFTKRTGFANYYFNQQERNRLWNSLRTQGSFADLTEPWKLSGLVNDAPFDITLSALSVFAGFPSGPAAIDVEQALNEQLGPEGSGGLLLALHMWRRLLIEGPERFGDVYYLGAAPRKIAWPENDEPDGALVDIIVATHDVVETHFLFDRKTGRLAALEMFSDSDVDPCSIRFSNEKDISEKNNAGRRLPHTLHVQWGDHNFGVLQVERWTLPQKSKEKS